MHHFFFSNRFPKESGAQALRCTRWARRVEVWNDRDWAVHSALPQPLKHFRRRPGFEYVGGLFVPLNLQLSAG